MKIKEESKMDENSVLFISEKSFNKDIERWAEQWLFPKAMRKDLIQSFVKELEKEGFQTLGEHVAIGLYEGHTIEIAELGKRNLDPDPEWFEILPETASSLQIYDVILVVSDEVYDKFSELYNDEKLGLYSKNPKIRIFIELLKGILAKDAKELSNIWGEDLFAIPDVTIFPFNRSHPNKIITDNFIFLNTISEKSESLKKKPDYCNQAISFDTREQNKIKIFKGNRYRSDNEILISKALDMKGIRFLANCRYRFGPGDNRENAEVDFLIWYRNVLVVLEYDGKYHTPQTRVEEQERDRKLEIEGGVFYVGHFNKVWNDNDAMRVVNEFFQVINAKFESGKIGN